MKIRRFFRVIEPQQTLLYKFKKLCILRSIFKVLERNSAKKRQIFILMISLLIEVKGSITLIVFKYDSLLFLVLLNSISRIVKG